MKSKIYMAGAGGMLGDAFYKVFRNDYDLKCTDIVVNDDWISHLDFRNYADYFSQVEKYRPDFLFHIGAHTSLEYCDDNYDDAYFTNSISVEHAVRISNKLDIPILYISTAGIFDGKKDLYDDWDVPNPLGHYARSKYAGETYVKEAAKRYLICRAGWMMGGGPLKDKKFIQKIMHQIKCGNKEIYIVDDKFGTPTYTIDFANNVKLLLESESWGLYNLVCKGLTSRLEVAVELLRLLGLEDQVKIVPVDSSFFKSTYHSLRPASERLLDAKLNIMNMNIMRDWKICLAEYIDEYYNDFFH